MISFSFPTINDISLEIDFDQLPGAVTGSADVSLQLGAFLDGWDFDVSPDLERALRDLTDEAVDRAWENPKVDRYSDVEPERFVTYDINLFDARRATISGPYNADRVVASRALPGCRWDAAKKVDVVDIGPEVLPYAERWGLTVSPDVIKLIVGSDQAAADKSRAALLAALSSAASPESLEAELNALWGHDDIGEAQDQSDAEMRRGTDEHGSALGR
jgi:hypothetical protein